MQLIMRIAGFLVFLIGLVLEVAVQSGPAAAAELTRLDEHEGVMIIRNLDPDVEFQQPLQSLHQWPSPKWPEQVEAQEEQQDSPEARPKEPQRRTGSIACNVTDRLAGRCISHITVHRAGRADDKDIIVHRAGKSNKRFQKVHRAGGSGQSLIRVHK